MIRKILIAFVLVSYITALAGIPVYFHYCGGELEEVSYIIKSSSCCGDDSDCCSSTVTHLKYTGDSTHEPLVLCKPAFESAIVFALHNSTSFTLPVPQKAFFKRVSHPPPQQRAMVDVSVLRI